jgi:drug/metabolite transporter (DMT)-like permease
MVATMTTLVRRLQHSDSTSRGLGYGLLGVLLFSLTLPATRVGVSSIDPLLFGLTRGVIASLGAWVVLLATRQPWPSREQLGHLAIVAGCTVLGFPLLTALALQAVPATQGAVILALTPLCTALFATLRAGERPSRAFWAASLTGSIAVVAFLSTQSGGHVRWGDLLMVAALLVVALGYAEGGHLARTLGGWQVVCWALALASPLLLVLFVLSQPHTLLAATPAAWVGLAYVGLCSQFLGFFAWYRGLALGGVARVGQVQLLQPFFTIAFAALLLGERITLLMLAAALVVIGAVWLARRAPVARASDR